MSFSMGVESVAIIGRNGMGKSTLCDTIIGLRADDVGHGRRSTATTLTGRQPERIAQAGIAYVPQGRRLFAPLTVDEHITMLAKRARGQALDPDAVLELFPRLAQRRRSRAGDLSGGEQQMLAVGRALLLNGSLVMMDEPSEGLAPTIVDTLIEAVHHLVDRRRRRARRRAEPLRRHAHGRARARDGRRPHRGRDDGDRPARRPATCNAATSASTRSRKAQR